MPLLHAAAEHDDARAAGEVTMQAVVVRARHDAGFIEGLILGLGARATFDHGVAAELAGDDDQRAVEQATLLKVTDEARDRTVDLGVHLRDGLMALAMRVPLEERHVLRGDLDEAGAVLDQASGEQAATAKAASVIILLHLGRLERDVESGTFLGAEQAIGVIHGAQHGLMLMVAEQVAAGRRVNEATELAVAIHETPGIHALRRAHGGGGLLGERQVHRAVFTAKETGGGEGLQLLAFADPFEALADVDEGGHHRIARAEHAGHPGTDVRTGDRLRRDVAGVPMELVT